ncbi:hypothetical protein CEP54_014265 [Fusarium duplospermum]|uniref:Uncharacterized protein n=1 Tax=Fusarium duplospermum TaxID=1325734 RepID=A0A428NX93_9HYPO|nr:hypothetical protein CEP54_014265 [Fusarium duplospermum]
MLRRPKGLLPPFGRRGSRHVTLCYYCTSTAWKEGCALKIPLMTGLTRLKYIAESVKYEVGENDTTKPHKLLDILLERFNDPEVGLQGTRGKAGV